MDRAAKLKCLGLFQILAIVFFQSTLRPSNKFVDIYEINDLPLYNSTSIEFVENDNEVLLKCTGFFDKDATYVTLVTNFGLGSNLFFESESMQLPLYSETYTSKSFSISKKDRAFESTIIISDKNKNPLFRTDIKLYTIPQYSQNVLYSDANAVYTQSIDKRLVTLSKQFLDDLEVNADLELSILETNNQVNFVINGKVDQSIDKAILLTSNYAPVDDSSIFMETGYNYGTNERINVSNSNHVSLTWDISNSNILESDAVVIFVDSSNQIVCRTAYKLLFAMEQSVIHSKSFSNSKKKSKHVQEMSLTRSEVEMLPVRPDIEFNFTETTYNMKLEWNSYLMNKGYQNAVILLETGDNHFMERQVYKKYHTQFKTQVEKFQSMDQHATIVFVDALQNPIARTAMVTVSKWGDDKAKNEGNYHYINEIVGVMTAASLINIVKRQISVM